MAKYIEEQERLRIKRVGEAGLKTISVCLATVIALLLICPAPWALEREKNAAELVQAAVNYYRGTTSVATVEMTIHRPTWERVMTIKGWTRGTKDSVFTIMAPPKDRGNGTLKKGKEMWTYNPKVNRVIKLPPSMMSQSWMGSDFSNNDLAKSDSVLTDYTHTLEGTEIHEGKKVYVIQSMPNPDAPVVWGMQRLKVREDYILLAQEFYDEDLRLVKAMTAFEIQMLGGRLFPSKWKMEKAESAGEFTLLNYRDLSFEEDLPGSLFTLSNLKRSRR
jgi:outer membrane lipoprotein-sorting protein